MSTLEQNAAPADVKPQGVSNDLLRRDVRLLGDMLGDVIQQQVSPAALELVERIRALARRRRTAEIDTERQAADRELASRVAELSESEARIVARAFSIFLDMANLAEDRHRVRVLRYREANQAHAAVSESIAAAISELGAAGFSAEQVQAAIDRLAIDLVFTAHPSEAKRRSIRAKLRRMRTALQELDREDLLPRERNALTDRLRNELTVIWQTAFLRPERPTVLQEVERGLSIMPRLWDVVPQVYAALARALAKHYPGHAFTIPRFLRFGSWMGGDRDGNPNVTADVTAQTLLWQRDAAISQHLDICRQMYDFLSMSSREQSGPVALTDQLTPLLAKWPEMSSEINAVAPEESFRRWVRMIAWRLKQSSAALQHDALPAELASGAYRDGVQLAADISTLCESLATHHGQALAEGQVRRWFDLARVFGLHLARLDLRQDSRRYLEVMTDVFRQLDLADDFGELPEAEKQDLLSRTMPWRELLPEDRLTPLSLDTLKLFRVIRGALQLFGPEVVGGHIVSLTAQPSDLLTVLWLWRWSQAEGGAEQPRVETELAIIPLFEKIGDLNDASKTLRSMLENEAYREHVRRQGDKQIVMVGYSDSTKDGGYAAACWSLYVAQTQLHEVATEYGVQLTFFHGRGGSLGRGGGPAARGILSLPPTSLEGSLRLTEQGEVLAERYDDVQIAYRHLEQVTYATLVGSALKHDTSPVGGMPLMQRISDLSFAAYRRLVDTPGFIPFFAAATPIDEIENLPIGSRPARRRGERTLGDLRAIPWVFSWTQSRCLIPAWYGLGSALSELRAGDASAFAQLRELYQTWPFFTAMIDNAALALAKADESIAARYAALAEGVTNHEQVWQAIRDELALSREMLLVLLDQGELLGRTPWLQGSIEARNPYIDPLNLIQLELLARRRALPEDAPAEDQQRLRDLLRLTVQGVAAGMRTTG